MGKRPLVLLAVAFLAATTFSAVPTKTVGRRACVRCHQSEDRSVIATKHDDEKSCEDCHGSGEAHVRSVQGRGLIFNFDRGEAAEVRARCGQCHHNPVMERHASGDISCISCHSIHHYAQKKYLLKPDDSGRDTAWKIDPQASKLSSQN